MLEPPKLPLPTVAPVLDPNTPQLAHHSPVFISLCQLWLLVHEILIRYLAKGPVPSAIRFDRAFVRAMLARLLAFGDQLPLELARGSKACHGSLILQ